MPSPRQRRLVLLLALALLPAAAMSAQVSPAAVLRPTGLAYDAAGNLYFADADRQQVFEATLGGQLLVVAGTGTQGYAGDGGPAMAAQLNQPQALAIGANGTLYIADTGNHVLRAISSGVITTVAGTGRPGLSGDNGPATSAQLFAPSALALDASGALLLCDSGNHRVRRIAAGVIATVAGTGRQGYSGDGGPATSAELDTPSGIAVGTDGRIFVSDTHNHRVRVVSAAGVLSTFAGTGVAGYSGDGGPASAAQLDTPLGLSVTASGALLIADANNQRIRSVSPQGTITTVAGGAAQGSATDGVAALSASLDTPRTLAASAFGYPTFVDTPNRTLRVLVPAGLLYVPAALAASRTSSVALGNTASPIVTVTGSVGTPQGAVQLLIDALPAASATLSGGSAAFTLPALSMGSHTLTAVYAGDGLNPAATSAAITVSAGKTASAVIAQPPAQNDYAGLPLLLNANVTSTTPSALSALPSGTVVFTEGTTTVATAQLAAGIASGVYLAPSAGTHTIVAAYQGDANFTASTAPAVTAVVRPMPDFAVISSGSATQTVAAGAIASYALTVTPQNGPFTGAVALSVSGLPFGAKASFTPPQVVPGANFAGATLNVQTLAQQVQFRRLPNPVYALLLLPMLCLRRRRVAGWALMLCLLAETGCGARVNQPPTPSAGTYMLTISATGTNLAGAVVVHSTGVTLIVE